MIEERFKVLESFVGGPRPVVAHIFGERKKASVRVERTVATEYREGLLTDEWDKLPKTPDEARERFLNDLREKAQSLKDAAKRADDKLTNYLHEVRKFEVKEIR